MTKPPASSATTVTCSECGHSLGYTLTNDGRIPDLCPECGADAMEVNDEE